MGIIRAVVAPRTGDGRRRAGVIVGRALRRRIVTRFAVGTLHDFRNARNRNRRNNPVKRDKFHAFFLDELAVVTTFDAAPNFVGKLAAPRPKLDSENNHVS